MGCGVKVRIVGGGGGGCCWGVWELEGVEDLEMAAL